MAKLNKKALIFWIIFFTYFTLFYLDILFIRNLTGILLVIIFIYLIGIVIIDSIFRTDLISSTSEVILYIFD